MVVLVHKCAQQTHLLALHLETLGYIPRLLNALNGLVYFLIIGDPRGDNLLRNYIACLKMLFDKDSMIKQHMDYTLSEGRMHLQLGLISLYMSDDMRFPTMWSVRPSKAQTSQRIRAD